MEIDVAEALTPLTPDIVTALHAVAEPNRVRIVALLGHGERCVCEAGEMLDMSTGLVSHHLRTLRAAGLLCERRNGRWVYYSLDAERVAALRAALTDLLTPTGTASLARACSHCASSRRTQSHSGPLRRLPFLAEVAP